MNRMDDKILTKHKFGKIIKPKATNMVMETLNDLKELNFHITDIHGKICFPIKFKNDIPQMMWAEKSKKK